MSLLAIMAITVQVIIVAFIWNDHNPQQRTIYVFEGLAPKAILTDVSKDDVPFFGIFAFLMNYFHGYLENENYDA